MESVCLYGIFALVGLHRKSLSFAAPTRSISGTYQLVRKYHTDTLSLKYSIFLQFFCLGGVLEENEVFNNRFEGICLATGVEPQLSSELTGFLFSTGSVRHWCISN